jgi:hypothetical protein
MRSAQAQLAAMGKNYTEARVRRDHELVIIANGTFEGAAAQKLLDSIHMSQQVSFDKDVQPTFHGEVQKTFSLFTAIAVFCSVGALAAVLLGLFLGGGRALVRTLQGKPAATELEFLSLHLDPQNKPAQFGPPVA